MAENEKVETEYRFIFDSIRDAVFIHELDGRFVEANQEACLRLGYSRDELLGLTLKDVDTPEAMNNVPEIKKQLLANGEAFFESEHITKNGERIPSSISSRLLTFRGKPTIISVARDLREDKKKERYLKLLLQQEKIISEVSTALVSLDDFDREIVHALEIIGNACGAYSASLVMFDRQTGEFSQSCRWHSEVGRDALIPSPGFYSFWINKLEGRELIHINTRSDSGFPESDSRIFESEGIVSCLLIPVPEREGKTGGFISLLKKEEFNRLPELDEKTFSTLSRIIQIALHRRSLDQETRDQKDLLAASIESLPHPFYMIDVNDYSILISNSATAPSGSWKGKKCFEVTHRRDTPCSGNHHVCPLMELRATGRPVISEHIHYSNDGEPRHMEVHGYPINDSGGNLTYMIEYSQDVTEKKKFINSLEADREKAIDSDRIKSEFLANMSHEIRTPLNSIIGFLELVIGRNGLSDETREYLGYSLESGQLLLTLINDILDLSKIEAGQLEIEDVPYSMEQLLSSIKSSADVLLSDKKKDVEFRLGVSVLENDSLRGDPYRLEQILNNLVSNAIKFTESGFIELGVSVIDSGTLEFHVRDSGLGMTEDEVDRIFIPFQQAAASTTRKYGGTGLGLAITKQLIELMGGKIRVRSVKGEGSTFYFTLPYNPEKEMLKADKYEKVFNNTGVPGELKSVLVAEDDLNNQKLMEHLLKKAGYTCRFAKDGKDAVSIYKTDPGIQAILMDIGMPYLSGLEAVRVIREYEEKTDSEHIPMIAVTAFAMKGDREKCLQAGFDEYLTKPVNQELLLQILGKYI